MKITNIRNYRREILIALFMLILLSPWIVGFIFGVCLPDKYQELTKTTRENRDMAQIQWTELWNTGESVSSFVDDRVPFRNQIIKFYQSIDSEVSMVYQTAANSIIATVCPPVEEEPIPTEEAVSEEVPVEQPAGVTYMVPVIRGDTVIGREGWMFMCGEDEIFYYAGTNVLSDDEMVDWANSYQELIDLCNSKGKELYFMIVPNKSQVYDRYMPSFDIETRYKREQRLYDYLDENTTGHLIYPLVELMQASEQQQVYYKYDTHWNMAGAYIGIQALYEQMGMETADLSTWEYEYMETDRMDLCDVGFIDRDSVEPDYDYIFNYKPDIAVSGLDTSKMVCRTTSTCDNGKHLVLVSDSFRVNMMPIIAKDFSYCTIAHRENLDECESDIKNADIIVVAIIERYDFEAFEAMKSISLMLK